jgi:primosomal protein N'
MSAYTVCPKCHFHEPSNEACSQCGTVFAKFYATHNKPKEELGKLFERQIARANQRQQQAARRSDRWRISILVSVIVVAAGLCIAYPNDKVLGFAVVIVLLLARALYSDEPWWVE